MRILSGGKTWYPSERNIAPLINTDLHIALYLNTYTLTPTLSYLYVLVQKLLTQFRYGRISIGLGY